MSTPDPHSAPMYAVSLRPAIRAPWTDIEPVRIGRVPGGLGTPDAFITVERDGEPFARIDAYSDEYGSGSSDDVLAWGRWIVLGWGATVWLVDPATRETRTVACNWYHAGLDPVDDGCLLVRTNSEIIRLGADGGEVWRAGGLGEDGVRIEAVEDGVVVGQGEWDPPDGWESFRVDLATGRRLA